MLSAGRDASYLPLHSRQPLKNKAYYSKDGSDSDLPSGKKGWPRMARMSMRMRWMAVLSFIGVFYLFMMTRSRRFPANESIFGTEMDPLSNSSSIDTNGLNRMKEATPESNSPLGIPKEIPQESVPEEIIKEITAEETKENNQSKASVQTEPNFKKIGIPYESASNPTDLCVLLLNQKDEQEESCYPKAFHATIDWQTIMPGQVLDAGLWIRLNFETDKNEARLLPLMNDAEIAREIGRPLLSIDDFLQRLKVLREKLFQIKSFIHSQTTWEDLEILVSDESPNDETIKALQRLLDSEFDFFGLMKNDFGLEILRLLIETPEQSGPGSEKATAADVRAEAAIVLGTVFRYEYDQHILTSNAIHGLSTVMRALLQEKNTHAISHLVFALSSILENDKHSLLLFTMNDGLTILSEIAETHQNNIPLVTKISIQLYELLTLYKDVLQDNFSKEELTTKINLKGWCKIAAILQFSEIANPMEEKISTSLIQVLEGFDGKCDSE